MLDNFELQERHNGMGIYQGIEPWARYYIVVDSTAAFLVAYVSKCDQFDSMEQAREFIDKFAAAERTADPVLRIRGADQDSPSAPTWRLVGPRGFCGPRTESRPGPPQTPSGTRRIYHQSLAANSACSAHGRGGFRLRAVNRHAYSCARSAGVGPPQ